MVLQIRIQPSAKSNFPNKSSSTEVLGLQLQTTLVLVPALLLSSCVTLLLTLSMPPFSHLIELYKIESGSSGLCRD